MTDASDNGAQLLCLHISGRGETFVTRSFNRVTRAVLGYN